MIIHVAKPAAPISASGTAVQFFNTGFSSVDGSFASPWNPYLLIPADGKWEGRPMYVRANGVALVKAGSGIPVLTISLAAGKTPAAGAPFRLDNAGSYFTPAAGNVVHSQAGPALVNNAAADESLPWYLEAELYGDSASGTMNGFVTVSIGASSAGVILPPASQIATRAVLSGAVNMPTGLVYGPAALGRSFQNFDSQKIGQSDLGVGPSFFPGGSASQDPVIQLAIGVTASVALAAGSQYNLLNYALYE